jgi:hypothetical protein
MRQILLPASLTLCGVILGLTVSVHRIHAASSAELMDAYRIIARHDFVDLTHAFGKTVDQIDPKQMFMPLVVLDVHAKAARNPDYVLSMDDVRAWEAAHGKIPVGAFVAMRTDWSKRWPNEAAMENRDRTRDDRHRPRSGHVARSVSARIVDPAPRTLPDRAARQSRPRAGGRFPRHD